MYTVYGVDRTRITLYQEDGVTPNFRITLQEEDEQSLQLKWTPEGVGHSLGSGSSWARHWTHRGHRPTLTILWAVGVYSQIETYASGSWGAPAEILTPLAIAKILTWGFRSPCLVEPHLDKAYSFKAQPDPESAFALKDVGAVAHTDLEITLIGTIVEELPDWGAL